MADALSARARGSTFLPNGPPIPVATVNWDQAWDSSSKGAFSHFEMVFHDAYIERVLQRLTQSNS